MGRVFRRKGSKLWQLRYRTWDPRQGRWGAYRDESSRTQNRREAEALLLAREEREEARRRGLVPAHTDVTLSMAVTEFLDNTQVMDDFVPERNRAAVHPVLGIEVRGSAWWIRTLDFASDLVSFFPESCTDVLADSVRLRAFDSWLAREGGRRRSGLAQSSRHKVLTWVRRLAVWCVEQGYLLKTGFDGSSAFKIPPEVTQSQARALGVKDTDRFWTEFGSLTLKAKVRVGLVMFTGARSGEVETIRASDVSSEFGTVRRRIWKAGRGGGVRDKVVRVPSDFIVVLSNWISAQRLRPDDILLPIRCQAGNRFLKRWKTSARGIRRTVLTRLHEAHVPLRVIQEVAGHRKLATTQKYLEVGQDDASQALEKVCWPAGSSATKSATDRPHQTTTVRVLKRQDDSEEGEASRCSSSG